MSTPTDPIDTFIHTLVELASDPPGPAATVTAEMSTDDVLVAMLCENTGRHLLDSGGAYGRAWERNQGLDVESFRARPAASLDRYHCLTVDVFHFLSDRLDFDAEMDALFNEFASLPENADEAWLMLMEAFPEWVADTHPDLVFGPVSICTVNSYNDEDALSQAIQYTLFSLEGADACNGEFVALQIHGGCDVRGGYTKPRLFRTGEACLFDNARATLGCSADSMSGTLPGMPAPLVHQWDTENAGYEWTDETNYPTRLPSIGGYNEPDDYDLGEPDGNGDFGCPVPGCTGRLFVHAWPGG